MQNIGYHGMRLKQITLLLAITTAFCWAVNGAGIDNSSLLPPIKGDSQVKLEPGTNDSADSPDWVKSLIIVEVNVASASEDGTFKGMDKVLDHIAETGANAIWITPIQEGRNYGNYGIHTINQALTGATEMPERWKCVKEFVEAAHKRNIRVIFDVVSWGVNRKAPLYTERPDWFTGPSKPAYHGYNWDWKNPELCEWFTSRLVEWILITGADGFRCDCAPGYAGYEPYRKARMRLQDMGHKIIFIAEQPTLRKGLFDFDQCGFLVQEPKRHGRQLGDTLLDNNLVDLVKNGTELGALDSEEILGNKRFYSYQLSCHDSKAYWVKGNVIRFGYPLFLPFLPIWYIGEEWNNAYMRDTKPFWLWANDINWKLLEQNQDFYEQVKRLVRIRRMYPDIFEYFPNDHRTAAICKVKTNHPELYQAYARYRNGKAILVVANNSDVEVSFQVTIPYQEIGIDSTSIVIKDLLSEQELASGKPENINVNLPAQCLGVYLVSSEK